MARSRVLVAHRHEDGGLDAQRRAVVRGGGIRGDLAPGILAEVQKPKADQRVPEAEHGPGRAEREADEQDRIDPSPPPCAENMRRQEQQGGIGDHVQRSDDPPPARQRVDGLQARWCRKAQGNRRESPAGGGVQTVVHATFIQAVAPGVGGKMMTRRSTGKTRIARAVWYARKGVAELRPAPLPRPQPGEALVRTLFSGISRGTERLVFNGAVGKSEWERMRGPNQEGAFPFPVKYGYCATGVVEEGPAELVGRTVFCLHPHQDYFNVPVSCPGAGSGRRAGAAGDAGGQHGDGAQCAVGRRRRAWRPHRGGGSGRGWAAGDLACGAAAGRGGDGRGPGREPAAAGAVPGGPVCPPGAGPAGCRHRLPCQRHRRGARHRHQMRRLGGHHRRDELVRRQGGEHRAGRRVPQPAPEARLLAGGTGGREPAAALGLRPQDRGRHAAAGHAGARSHWWPRRLPSRMRRASCRASSGPARKASPPSSATRKPDKQGDIACTPSRCATGS